MRPREPDPAFAHLSDGDRDVLASLCARRAALELQGAAAFTVITQALFDLRAPASVIDLSARAIVEEMRHSQIYRELAVACSGRDPPEPVPSPIPVPHYHGVTPRMTAALHVVGMCAINETMACGFLQACLAGATTEVVRRGLSAVLSDEIRHGRIGWAWLASTDAEERDAIRPFVLPLLEMQMVPWRAHIATLPARALPEHGCPSGEAIEEAALSTVREVVLPGFEALGMNVSEARAWLVAGAPHR